MRSGWRRGWAAESWRSAGFRRPDALKAAAGVAAALYPEFAESPVCGRLPSLPEMSGHAGP